MICNRQPLQLYQHNINGLQAHIDSLQLTLDEHKPDICILQECTRSTKAVKTFQNSVTNFKDYFRAFGETGRACILVKNPPSTTDQYKRKGYETVWASIPFPGDKPILVCSFYRDPNGEFDIHSLEEELYFARNTSPHIIFAGIQRTPCHLGSQSTKQPAVDLHELILRNHLHTLNNLRLGPTFTQLFRTRRATTSFIDVSCISDSLRDHAHEWCLDPSYQVSPYSPHNPITWTLDIDEINKQSCKSRRTWDFKRADWSKYYQILKRDLLEWQLHWDEETDSVNHLERAVQHWNDIVSLAATQTIPRKVVQRRSKPWWNNDIKELRKTAQRLRNRLRNNRTDENWKQYKEAERVCKNTIRNAKKKADKEFCESLGNGNLRLLFSRFRNLCNSKIATVPTLENEDTVVTDDTDKANLLARWFSSDSNYICSSPNTESVESYLEDVDKEEDCDWERK